MSSLNNKINDFKIYEYLQWNRKSSFREIIRAIENTHELSTEYYQIWIIKKTSIIFGILKDLSSLKLINVSSN